MLYQKTLLEGISKALTDVMSASVATIMILGGIFVLVVIYRMVSQLL